MWLKYLSEESFSVYHKNEKEAEDESGLQLDPKHERGTSSIAVLQENVSWLEKLHAQYAPSRKMKSMFFEDHIKVCVVVYNHNSSLSDFWCVLCFNPSRNDMKLPSNLQQGALRIPSLLKILQIS